MRISLDEARRIARLAHLHFPEEELERLRGQLDLILDYVGRLGAVDGKGTVAAAASEAPEERAGRPAARRPGDLREDVPAGTLSTEEALESAPDSGAGHFRVPRIIP